MLFFVHTNLIRKVDEINAEEEIREAFKVFDSVSKFTFTNVGFIIKVINIMFYLEWGWIHQ